MTTIDRTNATDTEFAERIAAFDTATYPAEVITEHLAAEDRVRLAIDKIREGVER